MKNSPLLHSRLSAVVAALGHGELLVIADAGLPVPPGVELIDLALSPGIPTVEAVLSAVLAELVAESGVTNAEQAPAYAARLRRHWQSLVPQAPLDTIAHAGLKELSSVSHAVVRTGEFTPYANVVIRAGVPF